jgi:two-component system, OmpR family, response regulator
MERLNILLVDDEEDLVSAMAERLMLRGFQVKAVTTATAALRLLREDQFRVLILDVKMPGTGGLKLLVEVKKECPDLPVILFTGHGSTADAERGMQEGAFDYLMKPVDVDDLVEKICTAAGTAKGSHA